MQRRAVGTAAIVALSVVATGSAYGDTAVFDDGGDVTSSVDVLRVRVDNGEQERRVVRVRVVQDDLLVGDEVTVFLDTDAQDHGPEWKVAGVPASEWTLLRVETWSSTGQEESCAPGSMRMRLGRDTTRVVLPRRCVGGGDEGALRVAVRATRQDPAARDWAEARRRFLAPVPPG